MSETYFKSFPKWENSDAVDLLTHVFPVDKSLIQSNNIEPITLKDSDHVERVAHIFYNDPHLFYILFLINRVIHPYEDWVMNSSELSRAVFDKYQSTFIQRHQERVIQQIEQFVYDQHVMIIQQKLPIGKYILKLNFIDKKTDGVVHLKFKYVESYEEQDRLNSTPIVNQVISVPGIYINELFFDNESEKMTRLIVNRDSHIKFKFTPINYHTIPINNIFSSHRMIIDIPTELSIQLGHNDIQYIEINHHVPDRIFYIQGFGKNLVMELYNGSSRQLIKTFFNLINFKQFISLFNQFNLKKIEDHENDELYLYSTQLIKKIAIELSQSFTRTQQIEGSVDELLRRIIDEYQQQFQPTVYTTDDFIDFDSISSHLIFVKAMATSKDQLQYYQRYIDNVFVSPGDLILVNGSDKKSNHVYIVQDDYSLELSSENINDTVIIVDYGTHFKNTRWIFDKTQQEFIAFQDLPFAYIYNSDLNIKFNRAKTYHYYYNDVLNDTHHFETDDTSILGAGMIVDEHSILTSDIGHLKRVSNYEFEDAKNNQNRFKFGLSMNLKDHFQKQYRDYLLNINNE